MKAESLSYGQLFWRDFFQNRMAVVSAIIIGFILLVAVYTPLIANQRPLIIFAPFQGDYINEVAVLREALMEEEPQRAMIERRAERIAPRTPEPEREILLEILSAVRAEKTILPDVVDPLFAVRALPERRFPAFRTLTRGEIFFMLAVPLGAVVLLAGRWQRLMLSAVVVVSALFAFGVRIALPPVSDTQSYRRLATTTAFQESGGWMIRTLVPFGENENIIAEARQPPTFFISIDERREGQNWHWLGTDTNGRDVLARMVYGARVSMVIGILAVGIYTFIGIVVGALAGYFGGLTDIAISRIIEIVICFPALIIILAVQAFLSPSLLNLILALAFLLWTGVARLQRAEFLRLVNQDFVMGVRALGGGHLRIIFLHILPNGLGPILVLTSFGVAGSILIESGLSYLGFGVPQPMASWGDLLNNGRNDIKGLWWLTIFPGAAIFLTVTCFNLLGEGIRDALDPRRDR